MGTIPVIFKQQQKMEERALSFNEWYELNEEEIYIELAETGADRELCFDSEKEFEERYLSYSEGRGWRHIKEQLNTLHTKFPNLKLVYGYDFTTKTHMVEVTPLTEYEHNLAYREAEAKLSHKFDNKFFPEMVMFVSGNSLIRVKEPLLVWRPKKKKL